MKNTAIILAAGKGSRFEDPSPKQFHLLNGLPLFYHSINAFHAFDPLCRLLLVIGPSDQERLEACLAVYPLNVEFNVINGGETRAQSVMNAMNEVDEGLVFIHDAARPCIHAEHIRFLEREALEKGNAVPALSLDESIRQVSKDQNHSVDRSEFKKLQTPQVFHVNDLKGKLSNGHSYTDESALFSNDLNMVQGQQDNIKVTYPRDIEHAALILSADHE